jgi:hypothetical protein
VAELLDPAAAIADAHGQLASALPLGGLAVSCHKLVEDGARAQLLHVPGLFRLDVRPVEDTLQVTNRSLHDAPTRWSTSETQFSEYHDKPEGREPSVVGFTFVVDAEPFPIAGRISLASTVDRDSGVTHFVAHAIVREVPPASPAASA